MQINHIGYAVKKIEKAIQTFEKLGFCFREIIDDTKRNIRIAFGVKDGYRIELVSPLEEDRESPVDLYLRNVKGTPYHICYSSEKLETEIERLAGEGYKIVRKPEEAVAFGGKRVAFLIHMHIGLIEIVEA